MTDPGQPESAPMDPARIDTATIDAETGERVSDRKGLVSLLSRTADMLEVLGAEGFRASAYRAAARSIEGLDAPLAELSTRDFRGIPKVGPGIASELSAYAGSGVFGPLAEAESQIPPGVLTLFRVRGLGPKKIRSLWDGGIDSLQALWEAAQDGRLAALKGFGARSAATLADAAEFALASQARQFLNSGRLLGQELAGWLDGLEPRLSGELRRGLETIGTVRLTVTGSREEVRARLEGRLDGLEEPPDKPLLTGRLEGMPVEVGYAPARDRGALDLVFGGGRAYREAARSRARELGLELSGWGLRREGEPLDVPEEGDALTALGWPHTPPEHREAEHLTLGLDTLPPASKLIQVEDIRGLLHTHSSWSDGVESLSRMASEAARLYQGGYLGSGDHSRAASYANGLDEGRLRAQLREVRELQRAGLPIVAGSEVD
ncbi:MAG: helix-hairpin-helix domain-containing protein, partial [Deinococcus sp.]